MSDFNKTLIFWTYFLKNLKYQVASKSLHWEPSCSMRTIRQTDMKKLIVAFRNFANAPKSSPVSVLPPQIPQELDRNGTLAFTVRSRLLTLCRITENTLSLIYKYSQQFNSQTFVKSSKEDGSACDIQVSVELSVIYRKFTVCVRMLETSEGMYVRHAQLLRPPVLGQDISLYCLLQSTRKHRQPVKAQPCYYLL